MFFKEEWSHDVFTKGEVWSSEALVVSRFKGIDATNIYIYVHGVN